MPMNEKDIPYVLRDRKSDGRGVKRRLLTKWI